MISLIITVKNERAVLPLWLESIKRQTLQPDEIVVVDGGSTDGTFEWLESVKSATFTVLQKKGNIAVGRNIAIQTAKGEIIVATDAGCLYSPEWLQKITDPTFVYGTGFNNVTFKVDFQSDGKLLVAHSGTVYNGTASNRIIRLNTDGTIDPTFDYGTGFNSNAIDLRVLSDEKILVSGLFTTYKGLSYPGMVRLTVGDTTPPTMTLSALPATVTGDFQVIACPSEPLSAGSFTSADVSITNGTVAVTPAFAGPTVTAGCPSGEYTFWVTPTTPGAVDVTVPAASFSDIALNANTVASNTVSTVYVVDTTAPVITNISVSAPYGTTPNYLANGSNNVTMTFHSDELLDLTTSTITIAGVAATCTAPAAFPGTYTCTAPAATTGRSAGTRTAGRSRPPECP
jgi:hypothetical protein